MSNSTFRGGVLLLRCSTHPARRVAAGSDPVRGQTPLSLGGRSYCDSPTFPCWRRSRFVGRPLKPAVGSRNKRRFSATAARRATLTSVSSYRLRATGAEPRTSDNPITSTSHRSEPLSISSTSPNLTLRAGLTRSPLTVTLLWSTASQASERVLKKRAAHSHLSSR